MLQDMDVHFVPLRLFLFHISWPSAENPADLKLFINSQSAWQLFVQSNNHVQRYQTDTYIQYLSLQWSHVNRNKLHLCTRFFTIEIPQTRRQLVTFDIAVVMNVVSRNDMRNQQKWQSSSWIDKNDRKSENMMLSFPQLVYISLVSKLRQCQIKKWNNTFWNNQHDNILP